MSSAASGRNYYHSVHGITASLPQVRYAFKVFDASRNLKMKEEQNLFIACAWMTNKERRLFRLFPHVLKVDVVKGTNQEDRPLLTASVRTSQGKYIFICRMLLSHERIISFRWFSLVHNGRKGVHDAC
eukprot:scaffold17096_cov90-Amphora_coffeaeformis.AAC.1